MANRFGDDQPQATGVSRFGDPVSRFGDPVADDQFGTKPPITGKRMSTEEAQKYVRPLPEFAKEKSWGVSLGSALAGAGRTAIDAVKGGVELGGSVLRADPSIITGTLSAHKQQFGKAKDALSKGRISEGAGYAAAGIVPFVGPAAASSAEKIGGAPEMPPSVRTPYDPQSAAESTPPQIGRGVGEAAALAAMSAPSTTLKAAGTIGRAAKSMAAPLEAPLRESALKSYGRALKPTKERNKFLTEEKVAPGLIDRGVVSLSRKSLKGKATANVDALGAAIDEAWSKLPEGESVPVEPILQSVRSAAQEKFTVPAEGSAVAMGPQARLGIARTRALEAAMKSAAVEDKVTGTLVIPTENLLKIRRFFDDIAARAGAYEGKSLADQSTAAAHELFANVARNELAKQYPDIAALNKEFSFWKNTEKVVGDTLRREMGQATPMGEQIAHAAGTGAGFVAHGLGGAVAMATGFRLLTKLVRSHAWESMSAVAKSRLADMIAKKPPAAVEAHIAGLLEAPPRRMPGVADASGPTGGPIPYPGRGISPDVGTRMLPPPSRIQMPGQTAASQTEPVFQPGRNLPDHPQNGKFVPKVGVQDMVPVRNPQTGRVEYVPKWTQQNVHASQTESPDIIRTQPAPVQRLDNAPTIRTQPQPIAPQSTPAGAPPPVRPPQAPSQATTAPAPVKRLDMPEGRREVIRQSAVSPRVIEGLKAQGYTDAEIAAMLRQ